MFIISYMKVFTLLELILKAFSITNKALHSYNGCNIVYQWTSFKDFLLLDIAFNS